jgi:hypothetical protein
VPDPHAGAPGALPRRVAAGGAPPPVALGRLPSGPRDTSGGALAPYEYLLPLVSVLVGLALADLLTSVHRLLRARRLVRWDWLPMAAALLAALLILDLWWGFYGHLGRESITFASFLPAFAQLTVLFLVSAAVLPDRIPTEGLDLRAFYDANRVYVWTLLAAYLAIILAYNASVYQPRGAGPIAAALDFLPNLLTLGLLIGLAATRRRMVHAVGLFLLLAVAILSWWGRQLGPL